MRLRSILPLALLLSLPAATAGQEGVPTVGVLPFSAASITGEDVSAVSGALGDMMLTELSGRSQIRLVETQQRDEVMKRLSLSASSVLSDAQILEIGRLLGAQYVVTGVIMLVKDDARLDMRLTDVESGEVARTSKKSGKRADFLKLIEQVADEFTTNLKVPARAVAAEAPAPAPVGAALAYSRGLDYEKRGKKAEARAMFARALEIFPDYKDARAALERIR